MLTVHAARGGEGLEAAASLHTHTHRHTHAKIPLAFSPVKPASPALDGVALSCSHVINFFFSLESLH